MYTALFVLENFHRRNDHRPLDKSFITAMKYCTVRVAYYEPAYYEHLFIMNQAEGPNGHILIAFVLNKVRLI